MGQHYTNGEIERAKMLKRRLEDLQKISPPPLSTLQAMARFRSALRTFVEGVRFTLSLQCTRIAAKLLGKKVCPHCDGQGDLIRVSSVQEELIYANVPCRLCEGDGMIGKDKQAAFSYGAVLRAWRTEKDLSLQQMFYVCGMNPQQIVDHESGLVPVDRWPDSLLNIVRPILFPQCENTDHE